MVTLTRRYLFPILFFYLLLTPLSYGQPAVGQTEPDRYFDFWVGDWALTWTDDTGNRGYGSNRIEKILDGQVLLESFSADSGALAGFKGKSFTVYQPATDTWKQTWVDNSRGYLTFTGEFAGDKRIFISRRPPANGPPAWRRMVFHTITDSAFTWDWEYSYDEGDSWELRWRIHYHRKE